MTPIKTKDFSVSQERFELKYNSKYDLYKTVPIPEDLSTYYKSDNYISHTDAQTSLVDKLYQNVKKITINNKVKMLSKLIVNNQKNILDIGCGTGSFLESLKFNDWNTTGVEPSKKAKTKAEEKGINCFFNSKEIENQKFDIITMWHVLEHVPDFNQQFKELKRLLSEKGKVVIAVPNFKSYDAKFYKEHWAAYDVPRHIWHFSSNAISKIAEEHNFKLIQTKPMWFDSFYVSLLSEKYKHKKINYLRAFGVGLLSNLKAIKNAHFSSKIYILMLKQHNA